ncbi:hypothetical protein [Pseudomonas fluorescens]|uniref:Uncharacterized protein n=1 Tax=Pseudomonas fluorescens TaxID=294 RepID=A0A423MC90_PSEFL|nr:hypothetical protein [Pseudomonas fluorescens]RON80768.1 hypothetical protein BK670_11265 [Pseudomonas fluorescens]
MQQVGQKEKAKLWLSQFDQGPNDRALAEKLLNSVNYCPLNEFKDSMVKLTRKVLPLKQPSALFIERELQPTKAKLPPPLYKQKKTYSKRSKKKHIRAYGAAIQAVKSIKYKTQDIGSEALTAWIANTLCRQNDVRFLLQPTADNIRNSKVRNFVVLTDFIGSGDRARKILDAMWGVASIRSWYSGKFVKLWVLGYSGTEQGIINVRSHRFAPQVHVVTDCPTIFNSFDEDKDDIIALCKVYGAHSENPLGYQGAAALLAFEHGAPNNMPAIFVSEKNRGAKRWAPLFPKRVTEYYWRSTDVDMAPVITNALEALRMPEIQGAPSFRRASNTLKLAVITLLAFSQKKRRAADLRRLLPLSLDTLLLAKDRAVKRAWITAEGALTLAGRKQIRMLRRQGAKFFVAPDPFAPYHPGQLRVPQ